MKESGRLARDTRARLRRRGASRKLSPSVWAVLLLYGFLLLWVWLAFDTVGTSTGPNGADFGVDFSHTYAAAHVLSTGHDPYDAHRLSTTQHVLLSRYGLAIQPATRAVLVGTSAFFLWLLEPLDHLPYATAAIAWMLSTYALDGLTFFLLLGHFGWRRRGVPAVIFLATPAVVLATYYGNMISVVFAAIAGSIPLLRRYPLLAGAILSVSMLKPQVALPIAGLIVLFQAPQKGRVIIGFASAFVARHVVAIVLLGPAYQVWWLGSFLNFSRTMDLQPNIISLTGLYTALLPRTVDLEVEITSIVLVGAITVAFWWRMRSQSTVPLEQTGWLWFLWLLATPYAHFVDEMVLVIPVVALLGLDARHVTRPVSVVVLYLLGLSILLFSLTPMNMQLLSIPLMLCAACLGFAAARYRVEEAGAVAGDHSRRDVSAGIGLHPVIAR